MPKEHIFVPQDKKPDNLSKIISLYFRKWVIHPIKRRAARYYAAFLKRFFGLKVIAVTGSAGKTSTKDMIASVLSQKGETVKSYKNIDPVHNIPMTILKCTPLTDFLVLEMGVEFKGEMDFYLWLVEPAIAVITNIYPTHTEFFGDEEGVFSEKSKLVRCLKDEDVAILYKGDKRLKKLAKELKAKVVFYGKGGDVRAEGIKTEDFKTSYTLKVGKEKEVIDLPFVGEHFVLNSLAASAVGRECGISLREIKSALEEVDLPDHRMEVLKFEEGFVVLDDSYNSNPEALRNAIGSFTKVAKGKKIAVLGDMLELGEDEEKYHKETGRFISSSGIDFLIGVGPLSRSMVEEASKRMKKENCHWVKSSDEATEVLNPLLKKDAFVLVKGSRSIGLDEVVEEIMQRYNRK